MYYAGRAGARASTTTWRSPLARRGRHIAAHAGAAGVRAGGAGLRHQGGAVPGAHLAAGRAFGGAHAGVRAAVRIAAGGELLRDPALLPGRGGRARARVSPGRAARLRRGHAAAGRAVPAGPAGLQAAAGVLEHGAHGHPGHRGQLRRPDRAGRRAAARPGARGGQGKRVHGLRRAAAQVRQKQIVRRPGRSGPAALERPAVPRRHPGAVRDAAVRDLPQRVRDRPRRARRRPPTCPP